MARILIVDDRSESRELLKMLCAYRGHETTEAGDGAEALARAREEDFDLVISDVLMPTMDGYELVRRLREATETERLPVIFCTAHYLTVEAQALAERCGVRTVLTKPIEPEDLLAALDRALSEGPLEGRPEPPENVEGVEREHLRVLTDQLSGTQSELLAANEKLSALVDLSIAMSTERDSDRLLEEFCRLARSLVGARYAGAAAWNRPGETEVRRWCALGIPPEEQAALRAPRVPVPIGVAEDVEALEGSRGLPEQHPPVGSTLVAPIVSMERVYGWVYLADKIGLDDFTGDDAELVRTLSKQLGRIYENGKLYDEVERHARKLELEIAERVLSEERLAERERQLSALFESAMDGMVIADGEGRCVEANPAAGEILGVPREEILGRRLWELAESEDEVRGRWASFLSEGEMSGELRLLGSDGKPRQVELRAKAHFLPERHLALMRDVTETRRLEEKLLHAAKMEAIGRLAGGVAHDFNNLLTVINGYSEILQNALEPGHPQTTAVEEIQRAGERSAVLTRQLLAFGRRQVLSPAVVDLNEVVAGLERLLERIIGEDIRLRTRLAPGLGRCHVDPAQIEQVLMNLAVNSRDAMPGGGSLLIETGNVTIDADAAELAGVQAGGYVLVAVTDTGTGMDRETRSRLFEPFFTTKPPGRGTGLGLATSYGIVKQSGGHVAVYSEPGRGATFKIYLPKVDEPLSGPKVANHEVIPGDETVLVVEDDDAVRRLAVRMLKSLGYDVLAAESASEALALLEAHEGGLDLLVTDVVMPDASGRWLADQVAARRPETKVLFTSGYTGNAVVEHGILEDDVPFLQKPFSSESLSRKIREALES